MGETKTEPWAIDFDDWIIEKVQSRDIEALDHYESEAPYARQAVPRAEHFVPLFIAMGVAILQTKPRLSIEAMRWGI